MGDCGVGTDRSEASIGFDVQGDCGEFGGG